MTANIEYYSIAKSREKQEGELQNPDLNHAAFIVQWTVNMLEHNKPKLTLVQNQPSWYSWRDKWFTVDSGCGKPEEDSVARANAPWRCTTRLFKPGCLSAAGGVAAIHWRNKLLKNLDEAYYSARRHGVRHGAASWGPALPQNRAKKKTQNGVDAARTQLLRSRSLSSLAPAGPGAAGPAVTKEGFWLADEAKTWRAVTC